MPPSNAAPSAATVATAPATEAITTEAIEAALAAIPSTGEAMRTEFARLTAEAAKVRSENISLKGRLTTATNGAAALTAERDALASRTNRLVDLLGIDSAADFDSELERVSKGRKGADVAALQTRVNELSRLNSALGKQKAEADKLAAERQARLDAMVRDGAVSRALKASGALDPDALVPLFNTAVKVGPSGPVFLMDDGSEVTVDEGVKSYFERHPALLANSQKAGAGSMGGTAGRPDFAAMTQAEYEKARRDGRL